MNSQAHLPIRGIDKSYWRGAKIVLASLVGAAALAGPVQSGVLLDNPLSGSQRMSSVEQPQISGTHRVSLDVQWLSHSSDQLRRFSVAQAQPVDVATSQRYSIGASARVKFEAFGEAALRGLIRKRPARKVQTRNDQVMLMLMLARLRPPRW
jgi:hypothetical protein